MLINVMLIKKNMYWNDMLKKLSDIFGHKIVKVYIDIGCSKIAKNTQVFLQKLMTINEMKVILSIESKFR